MALKISVSASDPLQISSDLLVVGIPAGAARKGMLRDLAKLVKNVGRALKRSDFTGKKGQLCDVATGGAIRAGRVALVGLGNPEEVDYAGLRRLAARGARLANSARCTSMAVVVPAQHTVAAPEAALAEGAVLGGYRFERFKTGDRVSKFPLEKVSVLTTTKVNATLRGEVDSARKVAESVCLARDLINAPPNELYPEALAEFAKELAKDNKAAGLSCTVLGPKQIRDRGMALLDAVGRGSARSPRLIHLKYRPPGSKKEDLKRLVFVGKGLTFDTGGICLKPAAGMEEMKGDMGGAANVIALMAAVAVRQPQAEIHGIIASAENMPDGNAYRPGDIFTSAQGKTVEIINTDAEGRLALADALHYAVELEPAFILDNATLTGACVVALGPTVSAFYSNRPELTERFNAAAACAGEAMWQLPLVEDLRETLKSDWADLKHMGDRWGGSITAALFLREFVADLPWIHVDVAGPSTASKAYDIYTKGGTGQGVLTYLALIDGLIADEGEPAEPTEAG